MPTILVIDDNKDNLLSLRAIIDTYRRSYKVVTAQSGKEGLKLAEIEKPDVIVLDVKMPEMDGYEVCRRLKADEGLKHIPIVFLTAVKTSIEDRIKGLELGGDAYLFKPVDSGELIAQMEVMLRIKKAEDHLLLEKESLEQRVLEQTEEIRESEAKYIDLYENAPDMFVSVDAKTGNILRCNQTLATNLGYQKDEIIGQPRFFVYHPDCFEDAKKTFQQFLKTGEVHDAELQLKRKDGSKIDVSLNVTAICDDEGKILYSRSIWRDITERKQAEEKLNEEFELRSTLLDNIPDCIALILKKGTHEIVASNRMAREIGAVPGKTCFETCTDRDDNCPFCLAPKLWKTNEIQRLEVEYRGTWYEGIWAPFSEDLYVHYIYNISERKRAADVLRTSEAQLSNAMIIAKLGYWEYDVDDDLFTFNDHFYDIFRTTAEKVGGYKMSSEQYARQLVHPDDILIVGDETRKAIETTDPNFSRQLEHRIIYADGEIGHISVRLFITKDEKGRTIKTYGANQDITERKEFEEALRKESAFTESLIETAPTIILLLDLDGRIVRINPYMEQVSGYSLAEVQGKDWFSTFLPKRDQDMIRKVFLKAVSDIQTIGNVNTIITKDGRERQIEWYDKTLKDKDGVVLGVLSIGQDITDRKQVEEELEKRLNELQIFNDVTVGRELKIIELKKEINEFLEKFGKEPKYEIPV